MPPESFERKRKLIVGRSGELAVMSELLWRGWTPARPEIDIGDDVFIIDDEIGTFWRVQVNKNKLTLNLYFRQAAIFAGTSHGDDKRDWTRYRDRWPMVGTN